MFLRYEIPPVQQTVTSQHEQEVGGNAPGPTFIQVSQVHNPQLATPHNHQPGLQVTVISLHNIHKRQAFLCLYAK
jgi:hypothetical protein